MQPMIRTLMQKKVKNKLCNNKKNVIKNVHCMPGEVNP